MYKRQSKGRYDHNKRHTDTYTGKGKSTLSGNMTNIDTIDDIVEHIDELCGCLLYTSGIEVEIAEFICEHIPHVDMIRMVNSGTEAVMSAIRAARGFTGKDKIIKFAGCYHGHSDCLLVSAGSGVMASGIPDSAGVPKGCTQAVSYTHLGDRKR